MTKSIGYLGIDAGTQGLSVIATDEELRVVATGEAGYSMIPGLDDGCYEQRPHDWEEALRQAMADLRNRLPADRLWDDWELAGIGISGQMHGEVLCDEAGNPLAAARLWCDARNEAEGDELTARLGVKMPKRITAARWLWTVRHRLELAQRVARITTPAGWLAFRLTGEWNLGIGDASGMFPIDQGTLDYDVRRLQLFDELTAGAGVRSLRELLPRVRRAGQDGGTLSARGANLLGLPVGISVAPAEGDQPAALAGSLIAEAGMVSMSFGTSVCANAVGDRPFRGVHRAIDHFCAVDGKPINMVFLRNGTTFMNCVIGMFGMAGGGSRANGFASVMPRVLTAPPDCEGILALPFMDDEPGLGVARGGQAALFGLNERNATPGNVAKAALLATIFNLRLGAETLDEQAYPRNEIVLSGGLTKTPELGQIVADVFRTPVTILESGSEGTAWGAALLAKYRRQHVDGSSLSWSEFVEPFGVGDRRRFQPARSNAYDEAFARYRQWLSEQLGIDGVRGR